MSSPSERYAAARQRGTHPILSAFGAQYPFTLDPFQRDACAALEDGHSVLVCAPTGAGKTIVGEFAVRLALEAGQKCFYTTPIKALSNQKYHDLLAVLEPGQVGLLTGDNAINADAPIVVMTTEVLRNMLYTGAPALAGLGYVVMDEVHYLGDRFRGAVWEEVIIHLLASVRLVSLSATVSNAEEFGDWLVSVRGETEVIVHEERPVPLWQHMLVGSRLFDLFADSEAPKLNPDLRDYLSARLRFDPGDRRRGGRPRGWRPPFRPDVITRLDNDGLLPAITFIFSRAGCDAAVRQCLHAGLWLTDEQERAAIDAVIEQVTATISAEDLDVLDFWDWRDGLRRGIAAHHAGLIPAFKEVVETLFVRGLVKAVFATETLALGINMPARTVVLERLTKFDGQSHVELTPGEYTQLTGRAGRRGIDIEGHAVVEWGPEVDPARVAGLASTRTYPLRSSFRPSYNMAVNLVGQMGRGPARRLLESSFAQFQADRAVLGLTRQIRRNEALIAADGAHLRCDYGDFAQYAALRRELRDLETSSARSVKQARRAAVAASLEALKPGDVIRVPGGRRAGLAVILESGTSARDEPRPLVLTEGRWAGRLSLVDFPVPVRSLARLKMPRSLNYRAAQQRRDMASRLAALDLPDEPGGARRRRDLAEPDPRIEQLRRELREHPCHRCGDREEHARWAEKIARLQRETDSMRSRAESRTGSLGRTFDRICRLLDSRGYLSDDAVTPAGRQLARIWSESDLVAAECLRGGAWAGLGPAELAAVVSALVYEPRREERTVDRLPTPAVRRALAATVRSWGELSEQEESLGLPVSREPELGFVWAAYRWARRDRLSRVLDTTDVGGSELTAGDFIRWCRQVVDLLGQIAAAPASDPSAQALAATAREASAALNRGIVAQLAVG